MIQRFYIILFTLIGSLTACNLSDKQHEILTPAQMRPVMWDMYKARVYTADYLLHDPAKNDSLEFLEIKKAILGKYKITETVYDKSYRYYMEHPDLMIGIIDSIQAKQTKQSKQKDRVINPD